MVRAEIEGCLNHELVVVSFRFSVVVHSFRYSVAIVLFRMSTGSRGKGKQENLIMATCRHTNRGWLPACQSLKALQDSMQFFCCCWLWENKTKQKTSEREKEKLQETRHRLVLRLHVSRYIDIRMSQIRRSVCTHSLMHFLIWILLKCKSNEVRNNKKFLKEFLMTSNEWTRGRCSILTRRWSRASYNVTDTGIVSQLWVSRLRADHQALMIGPEPWNSELRNNSCVCYVERISKKLSIVAQLSYFYGGDHEEVTLYDCRVVVLALRGQSKK